MTLKNLSDELNFVGERKSIHWFNEGLAKEEWFCDFIKEIMNRRKDTTLRNILYCLFPMTEYLYSLEGKPGEEIFLSYQLWSEFVKQNLTMVVELSANHGTQGNIPQRAAIILDYLNREGIIKEGENIVIELGCSNGLIGCVMENYQELFIENSGLLAEKYFWLKRMPEIKIQDVHFNYLGYEICPSPINLLPFFIWDKDKRQKVQMFIRYFKLRGLILQQSLNNFFEATNIFSSSPVILTSFVLYQFKNPENIQEKILEKLKSGVHWIDLSRNNNLPFLFEPSKKFTPNWIYLSHNSRPVAKIIDGSDDCPNWEYL